MAPPPPQPPELMEDLVEDILLRFPPNDPASLARAALVSRRWRRLIASEGFARRFVEFHRSSAPPLLGFLCNRFQASSFFVPTPSSSFRPPNAKRYGLRAVHAGHGRVLLAPSTRWGREGLVVWDPISDEQQELPKGPPLFPLGWNAAVLCAAARDGGCNHLGCHRGPFLVVYVRTERGGKAFCRVYSSETDAWSNPIYVEGPKFSPFDLGNSVLLGSALYFKASNYNRLVLKYDLLTQEMSRVLLPVEVQTTQMQRCNTMLIAVEDGRLGFAFVAAHESNRGHALYLWSREHGSPDDDDDVARWAQDEVIMLDGLKNGAGNGARGVHVAGFADNGAGGVVFILSGARFFSVDLKSGKSKKVGESIGFNRSVVPYVSFCIPGLGAVSADEEHGAGAASA